MTLLFDAAPPQPRRITEAAHGGEARNIYEAVKKLRRGGASRV